MSMQRPCSVADLSEVSYPFTLGAMKGITIKLPAETVRQLREQARQSGRSVAVRSTTRRVSGCW
jgi:hypothetical protein